MAGAHQDIRLNARAPSAPVTVGALKLASGGASQQLFKLKEVQNGCTISNPLSATDEGSIAAAEEIWVDFTGFAAVAGGNGTAISIQPGQSYTFVGGLDYTSVNWVAATTGHTINAFSW
jgi:hypothetical protein